MDGNFEKKDFRDALPELEALCAMHEISIELIRRSHDLDSLMDLVLDEYERRLNELQGEDLELSADTRLKKLVMFAGQASELKAKAECNRELQIALEEAESSRHRLNGVIESLAAGIVILDGDGRVLDANETAQRLLGQGFDSLKGSRILDRLGTVEPGGEGDVVIDSGEAHPQVRLVSRRRLEEPAGGEVILIHDITERERKAQKRIYREKMDALLQTIKMLTHQINNPLTSILGRAQILKLKGKNDPAVLKAAGIVEDSAKRISGLISDLTDLAAGEEREELESLIDQGLKAGRVRRGES